MLSLAVLTLISAATADLAEADEARAAKAGEHHATALRMARRVTAAPDQPHLHDALPHFRLAVRLAPSNADYQSNLGVAEMRVGGYTHSALCRAANVFKLSPYCARKQGGIAGGLTEKVFI